jgi:acyl-CoA reductase-like NAD-dependent aldehyde dehydrogenase
MTHAVVVNDTSNHWELHMPFGGAAGKRSGVGRIGGRHALEAVTDLRSLAIDAR